MYASYSNSVKMIVVSAVLIFLMVSCLDSNPALDSTETDRTQHYIALLNNTAWQLVQIQSMNDEVFVPQASADYILRFRPQGQLSVSADCNQVAGHWVRSSQSQLVFDQMVSTLAQCSQSSISERFVRDLNYIRSFVLQDSHLYLATMADGSILEFSPLDSNRNQFASPAYECSDAEGTVEDLICNDPALIRLDLQLDTLYQAALVQFPESEIPELKAYQRGWISGRNDCWKAADVTACIAENYQLRITELQIQTGFYMVPSPTVFECGNSQLLTAYFYGDTALESVVINTAGEQFLAYLDSDSNEIQYTGRNIRLSLGQQDVVWEQAGVNRRCNRQIQG